MVGKANFVMSAFHTLAVCMAHVTNHGSVNVKKDGVVYFAIKVKFIINEDHPLSNHLYNVKLFL